MGIEAVFLDRDGTIGGNGHFIHPDEFEPYDNFYDGVNKLKERGIKIFSFTNQHRISKGEAKIEDFRREFQSYGFTETYICPHEITIYLDKDQNVELGYFEIETSSAETQVSPY